MNMMFAAGRAAKAAKLHSLGGQAGNYKVQHGHANYRKGVDVAMSSISSKSGENAWQNIRRAANDVRGGDRWKSRGDRGVWHRWHTTPRMSLFTPYRVAKGPSQNIAIQSSRFTCGVTRDGKAFEFYGDWTRPENSHRLLPEPWIGYSVFTEEPRDNLRFQNERCKDMLSTSISVKWADIE